MSPDAIRMRLQAARPPDLRPESRLRHKIDMSPAGIRARLAQMSQIARLCHALGRARIDEARPDGSTR